MTAARSFGTWVACTLVAVAVGAGIAQAAAAAAPDRLYASARLEDHRSMTVAVLPAVASVDNPGAERRMEASWVALYAGTRTRWMPADEVRQRLDWFSGEPDLPSLVEREVWARGAVEPQTAARLARLLGVDAVLSLRIDRWEIVDGGRATVAVSAALVDAEGALLWSISGLAGEGRTPSSLEQNFNSDMTWIRHPALEPAREDARHLGRALYKLLARWSWSLPEGPAFQDATGVPPLLTLASQE